MLSNPDLGVSSIAPEVYRLVFGGYDTDPYICAPVCEYGLK